MKLTLLPRRQSGSRSDKRKARGRGLPPSSGVVFLSNEARVRVRSFGFVQPCCSGTLWLSDAVCLRALLDKQRQKREEALGLELSFCRNAIRFAGAEAELTS